jgi:hypothetical protein
MNIVYHSEILINATRVTSDHCADIYEFVLNQELQATECVRVESLAQGIVFPIENFQIRLKRVLFELNHVRVNPHLDNGPIIQRLTDALEGIGVAVTHPPHKNTMAICYKPLGEITQNVRFHFEADGKVIFLTPHAHLKLISGRKNRP